MTYFELLQRYFQFPLRVIICREQIKHFLLYKQHYRSIKYLCLWRQIGLTGFVHEVKHSRKYPLSIYFSHNLCSHFYSDYPNGTFVSENKEFCDLFDNSKPVFFITHGFIATSRNYNFSDLASLLVSVSIQNSDK